MNVREVLLCRDCCCGTERKHPEFDHAAQEDRLRRACKTAGVRLRVTKCLQRCEASNVMVLRKERGAKWLGGVLDPALTEALASFLEAPTQRPWPSELDALTVEPGELAGCDAEARP